MREVTDPNVLAVVRLAIAEAAQAPEVARTLDEIGLGTARAALRKIMTHAHESQLLDARPAELVEQFNGLLWGDLIITRHLEQPDCTCKSGLKYPSTAERATSVPRIGRMDIAAIVKLLRR